MDSKDIPHIRSALALGLPDHTAERLINAGDRLGNLFVELSQAPNQRFFQGRIILMGLLSRGYSLFSGALEPVNLNNLIVYSHCYRGLLETIGAFQYVLEHPSRVLHLGTERGVTAGKLRNAVARFHPLLGVELDRIASVVHPGDRSLRFTQLHSPEKKQVSLYFLPRPVSPQERALLTKALHDAAVDLESLARKVIATHPHVLDTGPLFMIGHGQGADGQQRSL